MPTHKDFKILLIYIKYKLVEKTSEELTGTTFSVLVTSWCYLAFYSICSLFDVFSTALCAVCFTVLFTSKYILMDGALLHETSVSIQ
jgi:hypothetical protein